MTLKVKGFGFLNEMCQRQSKRKTSFPSSFVFVIQATKHDNALPITKRISKDLTGVILNK